MTQPDIGRSSNGSGPLSIQTDEYVLRNRKIQESYTLQETPRYFEDEWRLDAALLQRQASVLTLQFASIPAQYRHASKELMRALLLGELPVGERLRKVNTIYADFCRLKYFLNWIQQRGDSGIRAPMLREVTSSDLCEYQDYITAAGISLPSRQSRRAIIRRLWTYREFMPSDHLLIDPDQIQEGWSEAPPPRRMENSTPRISEEVLGPLLAWSLRFVDDFSIDIVNLISLRVSQGARSNDGRTGGAPRGGELDDNLNRLLQDHIDAKMPLSGEEGEVNLTHLARTVGCARQSLVRRRSQIDKAVSIVGLSDSYYNYPIVGQVDGAPWVQRILVSPHSSDGLPKLARNLIAACYIVIAFLSGMRDSEVKHLKRGCVQVMRDENGRAYRWLVSSIAFKGEQDAAGTSASWVVGQPVARAISVLEQVQPQDQEWLFAHVDYIDQFHAGRDSVYSNIATLRQINDFASWVDGYVARNSSSGGMPENRLADWRFTTRQFRRTLAWFIARRPGGSVAGAIQYRHLGIQMFEGYAGTSDSGFRAEVEAEEALTRGEQLLEMINDHQHEGFAGPASGEARSRLTEFSARVGFAGQVVNDPRRLIRIMKKDGPEIYPGRFATCVFNPDKALCRRKTDVHGMVHPTTEECKPLSCRNVALTSENLTALREEISKLRIEVARNALPPLLLDRLTRRVEQIEGFLDRYAMGKS